MEVRFPTQDTVRAALIALLEAKGYDPAEDCVEVAVLSNRGPPAYQIMPSSRAASLLAAELATITGRSLTQEPAWVLRQGDVNLLFAALREQVSARRMSHH